MESKPLIDQITVLDWESRDSHKKALELIYIKLRGATSQLQWWIPTSRPLHGTGARGGLGRGGGGTPSPRQNYSTKALSSKHGCIMIICHSLCHYFNSPAHVNWSYNSNVLRWHSFYVSGHLLLEFIWQGCILVDGSQLQMLVLEKFSHYGRSPMLIQK